VRIINLITNDKYAGLKVTTDSGIEGKISIEDIADSSNTTPEDLQSFARVGMTLQVRVKEFKLEEKDDKKVSIKFSSKNQDLADHNK